MKNDLQCTVRPTPEPIAELDRLGDQIAELSAHLDAASARLLDLIREFDARGGWGNGFSSCAAWLTWRVGLEPGAAREAGRVARALGTLPLLAQALARGELSYSKIRALTRVASPETEERLLAVGRAGTAEHVERIVRGWRRVDRIAEARESTRRHRSRALHMYQDEDGMVVFRGRLAPEVGAVLVRALAAARETLYQRTRATHDDDVPEETPTMAQQQADALALVAETALHHGIDPGTPGERYQVVVHVDAPVLADPDAPGQSVLDDGTHVPAETSRRLACDATRVVMRHDADGHVTEVGARTRTIPPALRRALQHRDRAAASPAAHERSVRAITFAIGPTEAPPRCRISRCCVAGITARCTKRDIRWSDRPMETSASGDRTAGHCRKFRRPPRCRAIPSTRCERRTTPRGSTFTRGRRCRAGWETASMSSMRSTSCTHWRGPASKKQPRSRARQVEPAPMRPSRAWRAARRRRRVARRSRHERAGRCAVVSLHLRRSPLEPRAARGAGECGSDSRPRRACRRDARA